METSLVTIPVPAGNLPGQYVIFSVGDFHCATEISAVMEIVRRAPLREIPGAPPQIMGVVDLRGKVVPVLSLRAVSNSSGEDAITDQSRVIVFAHQDTVYGIAVDRVTEIIPFCAEELSPMPGAMAAGAFVCGVGLKDGAIYNLVSLGNIAKTCEM